MTIQDVIDAILREIPGRVENTVDTFKSGDPRARVTGIVTTFIATREVLRRAKELKANLVITHEPTYYQHRDDTTPLKGDPVLESKRRFIEGSGIAVWRFHDYWHRHKPDGILQGLARKLGWEKYRDPRRQSFFRIPQTTLRRLVATLKKRLGLASFRVTGDPAMKCGGIATTLGCVGWERHRAELIRKSADVLICGESHEWEACEYVRDSAAAGRRKALVVLGHCNSEEPGMEYLAEWLRPRVPGVPVHFVPAGDPFWYA